MMVIIFTVLITLLVLSYVFYPIISKKSLTKKIDWESNENS
jgi:hypothetical protein